MTAKWLTNLLVNCVRQTDQSDATPMHRQARSANLLVFFCSQGDVEETLTAIEVDEDTYEEVVRTTTRNIPMLFVRGDGIILISPPIRGSA